MKCPNCEKEFVPLTVVQKYCSAKCGRQYRRIHSPEYPSITFSCSNCGKTVATDGIRDKRTRFCCQSCEKKYWRHPSWERDTSRTNYRSFEEYVSWERRTNK